MQKTSNFRRIAVLETLGTMGDQLRSPLKPLTTIEWCGTHARLLFVLLNQTKIRLYVPCSPSENYTPRLLFSQCGGRAPKQTYKQTNKQIFCQSRYINRDHDCLYHFPFDLEPKCNTVCFEINRKMVNTISFRSTERTS